MACARSIRSPRTSLPLIAGELQCPFEQIQRSTRSSDLAYPDCQLTETEVTFDDDVVAEIVELSGGRPYYLQKLAYSLSMPQRQDESAGRSSPPPSSEHSPR